MTAEKMMDDALVGLDERLDRLLLTSNENERFVLSTESAKNIVGIVREWLRSPAGKEQRAIVARAYLLGRGMLSQSIDAIEEYHGETWLKALDEADALLALPLPSAPVRTPDMVGEYLADYSPLTPGEIAKDDPELTEMHAGSRPVRRTTQGESSIQRDSTDCLDSGEVRQQGSET